MTTTALFRDFLILNKAKQKFEKNWRMCHDSNAEWKNDFLSRYCVDVLGRSEKEYWHYLSPKKVFPWEKSKEGFDFWGIINQKWFAYFDDNQKKVTQYRSLGH